MKNGKINKSLVSSIILLLFYGIIVIANLNKIYFATFSFGYNIYLLVFEQNLSFFFTEFLEYWAAILYLLTNIVFLTCWVYKYFKGKDNRTEKKYFERFYVLLIAKNYTFICLAFLYILFSVGFLAPLIAPEDPNEINDIAFIRNRKPLEIIKYVTKENPKFDTNNEFDTNNNSKLFILHSREYLSAVKTKIYFDTVSFLADRIRFVQGGYFNDVPVFQLGMLNMNIQKQVFVLGTDIYGRDLFARIIYGTRVSLCVGLFSLLISMMIGIIVGLLSGYRGGWIDSLLMRFVDVILSFPVLFLILLIIGLFGNSIFLIILFLGLTTWMDISRLVRGQVMSTKNEKYILATRALGFSEFRILFRHILPNILTPIIINAVFRIGNIILSESALSFLGIGIQPPIPSWGNIINDGKDYIISAWWISFFPGLLITLTVLSFNFIGERIRETWEK